MKKTDLTRAQQRVLKYIEQFAESQGRSPTLKEIGMGVGCTAVSTIHKHVVNLIDKGLLERRYGGGNNIVLTKNSESATSEGLGLGAKIFPFYGNVAAGTPLTPESYPEPFELPPSIHRNKEGLFVLRVKGNSMVEDAILDGDLVVLQQRGEYRNGDRVVALIDREEVTIKELRRDLNGVWLIPHNPNLAPRCYDEERIEVQGLLVGVMRSC